LGRKCTDETVDNRISSSPVNSGASVGSIPYTLMLGALSIP
jgi:hypothetical protein